MISHLYCQIEGGVSKSPNISLVIGPRAWNEKTYWKSWSANLLQVSNLTFEP